MGKTLYLDCTNGISGDMTVAALLDLGANEARLRDALASLPVDGYEVHVSRVKKAGIDCCDFDVVLDAAHENHDHDMAYLHGAAGLADAAEGELDDGAGAHDHGGGCHHHEHAHHHHGHEHGHGHTHHDHTHASAHHHDHRGPADIDRIIDAGRLAPRARELAHRMVAVLAAAEAKAHAVPLDQVHFHEVGAVDSIVDIVSVAVCLDDLDVDRVIVPGLVDGCGTIRCQHGIIPVPVPATLNIAEAHGIPLSICAVEGELVTPTGAAIVAAVQAEHELPSRFTVKRVGLGAGKRSYARPSILRAMVIEELPAPAGIVSGNASGTATAPQEPDAAEDAAASAVYAAADGAATPSAPVRGVGEPTVDAALLGPIVRLECDIDDASGEVLAYAADRLRASGAREVHWTPVFTKKGRPAWQLQVIAAPVDVERLEAIIFAETTTIGIRRWTCERSVLERAEAQVETAWGPVRLKLVTLPDGTRRATPEYEDCAAIARREGLSLQEVMEAARRLPIA